MIDPKEILSTTEDNPEDENTILMDGSFGCPEQGCYEITKTGKFDKQTRSISWLCSKGHKGSATL